MKKVMLLMCISILLVTGCAYTPETMDVHPEQEIKTAEQGKAQVVFMRFADTLKIIGCDLFEVTNFERIKFIGSISNEHKIAYLTDPGTKLFMSVSHSPYNKADFMKANVIEGKTYFSMVVPNWGTGGFWLIPFRNDYTADFNYNRPAFAKWLANTKLLLKKPTKADVYFEDKVSNFNKIYKRFRARWEKKSPEEKQKFTMNEDDWIDLNSID